MPNAENREHVAIYPLRYTAADLKKLPEEDAVFFLMCGQLQNDLVILMRQLLQAKIVEGDAEPLRLASSTAAMLNIRMLAARLSEGWKLIKGRFQRVFLAYGDDITPDAKEDMKWLRPYFSNDNIVRKIRDNTVSHFDLNVAHDGFRNLREDEPMIDLHAHIEGNTIFFSGETLMLSSLHCLAGSDTASEALDKISTEILEISRRLGNVVRSYLRAFSFRHLSSQLDGLLAEKILIGGQARFENFSAPVYLAHPRKSQWAKSLLNGTSSVAINRARK